MVKRINLVYSSCDIDVGCFGDLLQIQYVRVKINHIFVHFNHSIPNLRGNRLLQHFNQYFSVSGFVTQILDPFGCAVN